MRTLAMAAGLLSAAVCFAGNFPISATLEGEVWPKSTIVMKGPQDQTPTISVQSVVQPDKTLSLSSDEARNLWNWIHRAYFDSSGNFDPLHAPGRRVACRFLKTKGFKNGYLKTLSAKWNERGQFLGLFAIVRVQHQLLQHLTSQPLTVEVPLADLRDTIAWFGPEALGVPFGPEAALPVTIIESTRLEPTPAHPATHRIRIALTSEIDTAEGAPAARVSLFEVLSFHSLVFMDDASFREQLARSLRGEWTPEENLELEAALVTEVRFTEPTNRADILETLKDASCAHPSSPLAESIQLIQRSFRFPVPEQTHDDLLEPWEYLLFDFPRRQGLPLYYSDFREAPVLESGPITDALEAYTSKDSREERQGFRRLLNERLNDEQLLFIAHAMHANYNPQLIRVTAER